LTLQQSGRVFPSVPPLLSLVLSRTLRVRDNGAADSIRGLRGAKRRTTTRIKPTPGRESLRLSRPSRLIRRPVRHGYPFV